MKKLTLLGLSLILLTACDVIQKKRNNYPM